MRTLWVNDRIDYDGSQLRSHFLRRTFGVAGDAMAGFVGSCDVSPEFMVDLEDLGKGSAIRSELMLHFICELFAWQLREGVLFQRVMVAALQQELARRGVDGVERRGDDLFKDEKKLTISIATRSPVSVLIHLGINISSRGTPVPTMGLADLDIEPCEFAESVLATLSQEQTGVEKALVKVRGVP